ncbi:unnamed protein product [Ostreobium quekettii]|uniref:Uncharacterized protein n=1 Tax=Ostreobium quekettii TaxID=121088 RepID=A0A8S1IMB9_9CHLO|nr:unnamed protein product [Ostreobium quekettii]CAD7702194.1 unnamed protein product [Ostreobium quekettii]
MRAIEWCVWWRTRLFWLPYGDQAIFVESSRLRQMGGFANQPLLEDVDLVLRLKRRGRPAIVQRCLQTSGRRWVKTGVGLAFVANQLILLAWALGMDPGTLASMYYGRGWQGKSGSKPSSE